MRVRSLLAVCACAGLAAASATAAPPPPPGATARCRDGTFSFSQHHSGTCSHHGGVAAWLDGSTTSKPGAPASPPVDVGATVLLAPRTRTSGCTLGANPDRRCSPGAYSVKLTKAVICSTGFRTAEIRDVPDSEKHAVEREYGLAAKPYGRSLEIDHIVSLELGGSNAIANLFPELRSAHPGYPGKDRLENRLHELVCAGELGLRTAQRQIAADWQRLYARVFGSRP